MAKKDGFPELIGAFIGEAIGYVFCMSILLGCYSLGVLLAKWLGIKEHLESIGLLSAFAIVWMYEHRRANERWERHFNR